MAESYGSNRPPKTPPSQLVSGIVFGSSIVTTLMAGALAPAAGLGVFVVGLLTALGLQHLLWLAEEKEAAETKPLPPLDQGSTPHGGDSYPTTKTY